MKQTWIGIDPGVTGAFAILGEKISFFDMPTVLVASGKKHRNEYDAQAIVGFLSVLPGSLMVAIERQQAMPDQGVSSTFRTGYGFGMLIGILAAMQIPYELVAPVSWKRALMPDMPKDKGASIIKAKMLFPSAAPEMARKKDHARADALLIAEFARRRQLSLCR